jgi:hypothetical protein
MPFGKPIRMASVTTVSQILSRLLAAGIGVNSLNNNFAKIRCS